MKDGGEKDEGCQRQRTSPTPSVEDDGCRHDDQDTHYGDMAVDVMSS